VVVLFAAVETYGGVLFAAPAMNDVDFRRGATLECGLSEEALAIVRERVFAPEVSSILPKYLLGSTTIVPLVRPAAGNATSLRMIPPPMSTTLSPTPAVGSDERPSWSTSAPLSDLEAAGSSLATTATGGKPARALRLAAVVATGVIALAATGVAISIVLSPQQQTTAIQESRPPNPARASTVLPSSIRIQPSPTEGVGASIAGQFNFDGEIDMHDDDTDTDTAGTGLTRDPELIHDPELIAAIFRQNEFNRILEPGIKRVAKGNTDNDSIESTTTVGDDSIESDPFRQDSSGDAEPR